MLQLALHTNGNVGITAIIILLLILFEKKLFDNERASWTTISRKRDVRLIKTRCLSDFSQLIIIAHETFGLVMILVKYLSFCWYLHEWRDLKNSHDMTFRWFNNLSSLTNIGPLCKPTFVVVKWALSHHKVHWAVIGIESINTTSMWGESAEVLC